MAWRTVGVREQRMEFVVAAHRKEKSFQGLCEEFGISRPTGYRWLRRYQNEGVVGMEEHSRRPHHSPERTPRGIEEQVLEWRRGHPDWGARKIRVLLQRQGVQLASSTIHRMLLRQDLVRAAQSHRAAVQRFEREAPNQLWQMDFKGPKGWNARVGPCRCSMTTAAMPWRWQARAIRVENRCKRCWKQRFSGVECPSRC